MPELVLLICVSIGPAKAAGAGSGIAWLIQTYPDKFGWLEAVLKFLF